MLRQLTGKVWHKALGYGIPVGRSSVRILEVGLRAQEAEVEEADVSRAFLAIEKRAKEALRGGGFPR